jgi:hypothetical protein
MFLMNSAFVGKLFLYLSKCMVKQQLRLLHNINVVMGSVHGNNLLKTSEQLTVVGAINIIAVLSLLFTNHASSMSHHTGLFENSHACSCMCT